jgi:hypothetical protein
MALVGLGLRPFILYSVTAEKIKQDIIPNLSLSLNQTKPAAEGKTSPEKTDRYELRSRGPATQGPEVLDSLAVCSFHSYRHYIPVLNA